MSQNKWILAQLEAGRGLTTFDCFKEQKITRAPSRIHDLRSKGHNITTTMVYDRNADGDPVHYAVWRLAKEQEAQ